MAKWRSTQKTFLPSNMKSIFPLRWKMQVYLVCYVRLCSVNCLCSAIGGIPDVDWACCAGIPIVILDFQANFFVARILLLHHDHSFGIVGWNGNLINKYGKNDIKNMRERESREVEVYWELGHPWIMWLFNWILMSSFLTKLYSIRSWFFLFRRKIRTLSQKCGFASYECRCKKHRWEAAVKSVSKGKQSYEKSLHKELAT